MAFVPSDEDLEDFVELLAPYCYGEVDDLLVLRSQVQRTPPPPFVPWMTSMFEALLDESVTTAEVAASTVCEITGDDGLRDGQARQWLINTFTLLTT
jgi:hypothetical protein